MTGAKQIESGLYEYRGFHIAISEYGWSISEPVQKRSGVDYVWVFNVTGSISNAMSQIDSWKR